MPFPLRIFPLLFAHKNPHQEVGRIAHFLGQNLSKALIDDIVQNTTFVAMRDNPMANYSSVPDSIFDRRASEFMRKGQRREQNNVESVI